MNSERLPAREPTAAPVSPGDLRRRLCDTKYFGLRPQPLERYLYRLRLTRSAERVFWLHWDAGLVHGDFCSEIPISQVAAACHIDTSSVTRAYQALKRRGLIRRQDPGRDPSRPFQQATALTEVLLPYDALADLFAGPDRRRRPQLPDAQKSAVAEHATLSPAQGARPVQLAVDDPLPAPRKGEMKLALRALAKLADGERASYERYRSGESPRMEWNASTQLTTEERELLTLSVLRARRDRSLAQGHDERHHAAQGPARRGIGEPTGPGTQPRRVSPFSLAYLRKKLTEHVPLGDAAERLREVSWSLERGALARLELRLGMNVALKKIREGQWTRPHRMPPNWQLPDQA